MLPVTQHTQPLKVSHLLADLFAGIGAAERLHLVARQAPAVVFFDLVFDGQAVAVPARHIARIKAGQLFALHHHVFEDLVDGMADVQLAIGIGRAVMQHKERCTTPCHPQTSIQATVLLRVIPGRNPRRFALGQVAAHRERGVGQIQGGAIVGRGGHGVPVLAIQSSTGGCRGGRVSGAGGSKTLHLRPLVTPLTHKQRVAKLGFSEATG